jgi:L-alanine-DL-glutamate epimerase-like enolase superfamily enzyme
LIVESVKAFPLRIKAKESLRGGTFSYSHYQTVLVKTAVDGVEGWGEAMTRTDPEATALLVRQLGAEISEREFHDVKTLWEKLWRDLRVRGHTRGVDMEALSGVEISLFDAVGRIQGKPLCELFAKAPSKDVAAFAGSLFTSRGSIEGQVELARAEDLLGAKIKIGFGVEKDAATLGQVRRLWPEGMLVADANGAYDVGGARKACSAFLPLDLAWFEEPVLSDDLDGYFALKKSGVRIGAGESWFAGDFRRPLEEGLVQVVEPSVSRCGGIGVEVEVAKRAKALRIDFSPMTGMNSAISLAASLHAAAVADTVGVEYNPFPNPIQTELATGLDSPHKGRMRVPSRPGLGVEIDERFVRSHAR